MSINFTEQYFDSTLSPAKIHACFWQPSKKPKFVLQIIHGMAEYIERYNPFAQFIAENGGVVCGEDHLGHGKTACEQDRGYIAKKDGYVHMIDDAHRLTQIAKEKFPGLPVFILGHSMGSFILECYIAKYGSEIDGAVVSGTGGSNPLGGAGIAVTRVIQLFKGERWRSAFVNNMAFGSYNKKYTDVRSEFDWLNRDRDEVQKYVDDPLCGFTFTLSGFRDLFRVLAAATRKGWENDVPSALPLLYIAGSEDPVGNYGAGPREMSGRLSATGHGDVTLTLYSGMRHEVLNEQGKQQVWDDILNWVSKRAQSDTKSNN